ncbi:response regulator [Nostoc sp. HG1]|nr:response regulator [Nostoc sp. HG1]
MNPVPSPSGCCWSTTTLTIFCLTSEYLRDIHTLTFEIGWAKNFNEAVEQIASRCHDIYFFDFLLGPRTGLELLEEALQLRCEGPIVLLTGKGDQQIDREATFVHFPVAGNNNFPHS